MEHVYWVKFEDINQLYETKPILIGCVVYEVKWGNGCKPENTVKVVMTVYGVKV